MTVSISKTTHERCFKLSYLDTDFSHQHSRILEKCALIKTRGDMSVPLSGFEPKLR